MSYAIGAPSLADALIDWAMSREPDRRIGQGYLHRWYLLPRTESACNLYLHRFVGSDDDRALHDHPWHSTSMVLRGMCFEHVGRTGSLFVGWTERFTRLAGDVVERDPETPHRIEIPKGGECWTLFATGPYVREWGFWCASGWRHWREFTDPDNPDHIGRGCG